MKIPNPPMVGAHQPPHPIDYIRSHALSGGAADEARRLWREGLIAGHGRTVETGVGLGVEIIEADLRAAAPVGVFDDGRGLSITRRLDDVLVVVRVEHDTGEPASVARLSPPADEDDAAAQLAALADTFNGLVSGPCGAGGCTGHYVADDGTRHHSFCSYRGGDDNCGCI